MMKLGAFLLMATSCHSVSMLAGNRAHARGDMEISSLSIVAPEGQEAHLRLGSGDLTYSVGIDADGQFEIKQGDSTPFFSVTKSGNVVVSTKELVAASLSAKDGFRVADVSQWYLFKSEDFSSAGANAGWTVPDTTECGGISMMGGYNILGNQGTKKTYSGIPEHTRVRVTGVLHFIDLWQGETAFVKLSSGKDDAMEFVFTERYELNDIANAIDLCGDDRYGEAKFSAPFDITILHASDKLTVEFGSTLPEGADEGFFGVSGLEIQLRSL